MDTGSVCDSEDDEWLLPLSGVSRSSSAITKVSIEPGRSPSPDELATRFDEPSFTGAQLSDNPAITRNSHEISEESEPRISPQNEGGRTKVRLQNQETGIKPHIQSILHDDRAIDRREDLPPSGGGDSLLQENLDAPITSQQESEKVVPTENPFENELDSPVALIGANASGRTLRPRTYQQLHTYEYEHAKYVLECRAAGIKPVRFDGNKYREMDNNDRDFVPARTSKDAGTIDGRLERLSSFENELRKTSPMTSSATVFSRKRKRSPKVLRFKAPLQLDRALQENVVQQSNDGSDVFDFLDQHWQGGQSRASSPHSSILDDQALQLPTTGDLEKSFVSLIDDTTDKDTSGSEGSVDLDAEARARFAKKLKGILPPSFLLRRQDHSNNRAQTKHKVPCNSVSKLENPNDVVAVKGLARKKMSIPVSTVLGHSEIGDEDSYLEVGSNDVVNPDKGDPVAQRFELDMPALSSDHDDEDSIMEEHETFDRMLPHTRKASTSRIKAKNDRARLKSSERPLASGRCKLKPVTTYPQDMVSRELRLGYRSVKKTGRNELSIPSRKVFRFHDQAQMLETGSFYNSDNDIDAKVSAVNDLLTIDSDREVSRTKRSSKHSNVVQKGPNLHSNLEERRRRSDARPKKQSRLKLSYMRIRRQLDSRGPSSGAALLQTSAITSSPSRSETSVEKFSNDENDDQPDQTDKPGKDPSITATRRTSIPYRTKAGNAFATLSTRKFATHLEHENGRFASAATNNFTPRSQVRNSKSSYLARFDRISNLFGQEESVATKVSSWQYNKLQQGEALVRSNRTNALALRSKVSGKKPLAVRRHILQQSILPFDVLRPDEDVGPKSKIHSLDYNRKLKSQMLDSEMFFSPHTFIGSTGLARLLQYEPVLESSRTCYIAGRQLQSNNDPLQAIVYGFTFVSTVLDNAIADDCAEQVRDTSIYEFLRFASGFIAAEPLELSKDYMFKLCDRMPAHSHSVVILKYFTWLTMFGLIATIRLQRTTDPVSYLEDRIVSSELHKTLKNLLQVGTSPISLALSQQRESSVRKHGIGISMYEGILELWTVLYHVCNMTTEPFWTRINSLLTLSDREKPVSAERSWSTIFEVMPVTQFDKLGRASGSMEANWQGIDKLLQLAFDLYSTECMPHSSVADTYIWVVLRRLHELICVWRWPCCSILLGHGRSGGTLHDFFFKILHLSSLKSENVQIGHLASFLLEGDLDNALTYQQNSLDLTFEIFLKLVCLGLRQYIADLETKSMDLERAKKKGIGVVDKFATLGRLHYPATQSIERHVVAEIQNRYSLEIAVYWTAGVWKDRGVSRLIHASIEALPNSHLILRSIQTQAWEIITKLQLKRNEEDALQLSSEWITAIIQTTASDVLQFRHQSRLIQDNAKSQARINQNVRRCLESLTSAFMSLQHVLCSPNASTTTRGICLIWPNAVLQPFLQLHESFMVNSKSDPLIRSVFKVVDLLLKLVKQSSDEADSQDYGCLDLSQEVGNLVDHDELLNAKLKELLSLLFKFLTNLTAKDSVTTKQKFLAKYGLESFASAVSCLRRRQSMPWSQFFDSHGEYSWHRLLDNPIKAIMLPYFLAILVENEPSFYKDMQTYILSSWLQSIVQFDLRDSIAVLTTVLFNKTECKILHAIPLSSTKSDSVVISSAILEAERTTLVVGAIRAIGQAANVFVEPPLVLSDRVQLLANLLLSLRNTWISINKTDHHKSSKYAVLIQTVLAALHQYCHHLLKSMNTEAVNTLAWMQDSSNVPQIHSDFSADTFRAFANDDLRRKGLEIALTLVARCDADTLDGRNAMPSFLSTALSNNPLELTVLPCWDDSIARLRVFVVTQVLGSFLRLCAEQPSARVYLIILDQSLDIVYKDILKQSWAGQRVYINNLARECQLILAQFSPFTNLLGKLAQTLHSIRVYLARHLPPYSTTNISPIDESVSDYSRDPQSIFMPNILNAIRTNLQNNWFLTEAGGLYHNKRKVTIPLPADSVNTHGPTTSSEDFTTMTDFAMGDCVALGDLYL